MQESNMEKILLIEDEESILIALKDDLELEGYQVTGVENGKLGLEQALKQTDDLIILDLMLPDISGFEICKKLREEKITTPILMLTAKSQELDKVLGLELGADDYVTKPFSRRELLARIHAIMRRVKGTNRSIDRFSFSNIKIDFKKYEVKKAENFVYLTALEFELLYFLITHKEEVLTRNCILDNIWGGDVYVTPRTVDTHIAHLRKKILPILNTL